MPLRIFLVEDHAWGREALAGLLELEEDLVVCGSAASAEEALEALPEARADVLVTDLALDDSPRSEAPAMSGLDLVAAVRARWPGLPAIVFSGKPAAEHAAAAQGAGAVGYIEKGDAVALLAAIRSAAGR